MGLAWLPYVALLLVWLHSGCSSELENEKFQTSSGIRERDLGGSDSSWSWSDSSWSWSSSSWSWSSSSWPNSDTSWSDDPVPDNSGCLGEWCYVFHGQTKTWREAQEACKAEGKGGSLVKISSHAENDYIWEVLMQANSDLNAWLGGNDKQSEGNWVWSRDNSTVDYKNWYHTEPNNAGKDGEDCMEIKSSGTWNDNACFKNRTFICEQNLAGAGCSSGYTQFESSCYKLHQAKKSWDHALKQCKSEGGDLVKITSTDETAFIWETLLGEDPDARAWAGGNDHDQEGTWVWSVDGSTLESEGYTNWYGEPNNSGNEDCMEIRDGGTWNDNKCDNQRSYICQSSNPVPPTLEQTALVTAVPTAHPTTAATLKSTEAFTEATAASTEAATKASAEGATETATEVPTVPITEASTEGSTPVAATEAASEAATLPLTEAATIPPTELITDNITALPQVLTLKPTEKHVVLPTQPSTPTAPPQVSTSKPTEKQVVLPTQPSTPTPTESATELWLPVLITPAPTVKQTLAPTAKKNRSPNASHHQSYFCFSWRCNQSGSCTSPWSYFT